MSSTILLATDARHDVAEPIELARELCQGTQGRVLVLHIHEFSVGRYGRVQLCCLEDQAEDILPRIGGDNVAQPFASRRDGLR